MSVEEVKRCKACGKEVSKFFGRELCSPCYYEHVMVPKQQGREPTFPVVNEFPNRKPGRVKADGDEQVACANCGGTCDRGKLRRGLCIRCYNQLVMRPRKHGEPDQWEHGRSYRRKGAEEDHGRPADRRKAVGAVREAALATMGPKEMDPERLFWAHACWLSEELGVSPRDMFCYHPDKADRLHDHDPAFRVPLKPDSQLSTDLLQAISAVAFGQVHPLVHYVGRLIDLQHAQRDLVKADQHRRGIVDRIQGMESAIAEMREAYCNAIRGEEVAAGAA
jgi:hypothetical protein